MSIINKLNLTARPENTSSNPLLRRRERLLGKIDEQKAMATAHVAGEAYTCFKEKWQVNPETKVREKVRVPKQVKPWYFKQGNKYYLEVRYANKPLELQEGMHAIEVGAPEDLVSTIEQVIEAVVSGELDELLVPIAPINKKKKTAK